MSGWYEQAFRRVLYPAYETGLRRRSTLSWLASYERDQWHSPEAIATLQFQKLKTLIEQPTDKGVAPVNVEDVLFTEFVVQ